MTDASPFRREGHKIFRPDGQLYCIVVTAAEGDKLLTRLNAAAPSAQFQGAGDWVTDDVVERASKAYAEATGYYVEFHRGLSSISADKIRAGTRAALKAALAAAPSAPQPEASGTVDRSALIEAATENIDNLVSRNGGGALSEIHRDLVYEEVAKCVDAVAAIIRASARPGLSTEDCELCEEVRARLKDQRPLLWMQTADLLAIIDRLCRGEQNG